MKTSKEEDKLYKDKLWKRFFSGEDYVYNELLLAYMPLVETTAKTLKTSLPQHVELDDLISDGFIGLMEAVKRFDNSQGYKFETYASLRIRGEIIDKLRVSDWAPRSLRLRFREVEKASEFLTSQNNEEPSEREIADLLGWELEEVQKIKSDSVLTNFINIDELVTVGGSSLQLSEVIADMQVPVDELDYEPLLQRVIEALDQLDEQDKTIIALFYIKNVSLTEIGELLEVTDSRACQMQTSALSALRDLCVPS
jgi:RNA polymerase sigma factor FliA